MGTLSEHPQQTFPTQEGTLDIWLPARSVMVTRVVGVMTDKASKVIEDAIRRQVTGGGRHVGFHNWEEMTDYEPAARTRLTTMALDLRASIETGHFLLRSRVVSFGVQIANIVLRNLVVHSTREAFERALEEEVRRRGRMQPTA